MSHFIHQSLTLSFLGPEYGEWSFAFSDSSDPINRFYLRGHGLDDHSRLHTLRHILMNTVSSTPIQPISS